ncbi:MAG TPA: hypothetical protein VKY27_00290 [Bacteriovoracaceae bacterium]|nr:hypothetical protein [Bacteriovoracaceae bacterium]
MDYQTLFIELLALGGLGLGYYFWQKRRILSFEKDKEAIVAAPLLQACLIEQEQKSFELLDNFIFALDDFLHGKTSYFPVALAKELMGSKDCPEDLSSIIEESLREIGHD